MITDSNSSNYGPNDGYGYDYKTILTGDQVISVTAPSNDIIIKDEDLINKDISFPYIDSRMNFFKKYREKVNDSALFQIVPKSKIKLRKTSTAEDLLKLFED